MTHPFDPTADPDAFQAPWEARALPAGARVRWIEIVSVIAEARSSIVYRATDHASDAEIVLKEYMPLRLGGRHGSSVVARNATDTDAFARGLQAFLAEGELLARVEHPSLVRVIDIVEANGTAYHVMPHREGTPLLQLREQMTEPPSDDALRALLDRLLGALQVLHEDGSLHGGISPRKILMLENDRPLLLGPDLARADTVSDLIESLMANVEPSFAAPEQRQPSPAASIGPWTDFYSLAQTLRFCLTGEMPPPAAEAALAGRGEPMAQMVQRLFGEPIAKTYSISLLDALDAALDPAPAGRPRDVAEFRAALAKRPQLRPLDVPTLAVKTPDLSQANRSSTDFSATAGSSPEPAATILSAPDNATRKATATDTAQMNIPLVDPFMLPTSMPAAENAPRGARVEPAFDRSLMAAAPSVTDAPRAAAPVRAPSPPPPPPRPPTPAAPRAAAPRETATAAFAAARPAATVQDRVAMATRRKSHGEFWAGAALASLIAVGLFTWWRNNQPVEFALPTQPTGGAVTAAPRELPQTTTPPPEAGTSALVKPSTTTPAPEPVPALTSPPVAAVQPDPARAPPPPVATPAPAPIAAAPAPAPKPEPPANSSARPVRDAPRATARTAATPAAPAAPTLAKAASPRAACGERTPFALYRCMQSLCAQPAYAKHAQCERLRSTDSVD